MTRKHWVTIVYKSGAKARFKAKNVKVTKTSDGHLEAMSWSGTKPHPMHIGIHEIAAVYRGKA